MLPADQTLVCFINFLQIIFELEICVLQNFAKEEEGGW